MTLKALAPWIEDYSEIHRHSAVQWIADLSGEMGQSILTESEQ